MALTLLMPLMGPTRNSVVHGNYDCVSCIAVDYPLHTDRCSSQFNTSCSDVLFSTLIVHSYYMMNKFVVFKVSLFGKPEIVARYHIIRSETMGGGLSRLGGD